MPRPSWPCDWNRNYYEVTPIFTQKHRIFYFTNINRFGNTPLSDFFRKQLHLFSWKYLKTFIIVISFCVFIVTVPKDKNEDDNKHRNYSSKGGPYNENISDDEVLELESAVKNKSATDNKNAYSNQRGNEIPSLAIENEQTNEITQEEIFPIEITKILKDSTDTWSLVGIVRNNSENLVRGYVKIYFINKNGEVFHNSQTLVVGQKAISQIITGNIPLLPKPEWIKSGEFGWFTLPEESVVFDEAKEIKVIFVKL